MRISVENTASHFQTRAVERFVQQLKTALDRQIDVQFFSNARLLKTMTNRQAAFFRDLMFMPILVMICMIAAGWNTNKTNLPVFSPPSWTLHFFSTDMMTVCTSMPKALHSLMHRADKGYWKQMETYIHEHYDAQFSHSICRECAEKFYPDLDIYEDENN